MGLDIYVGSFTRYHRGDWETVAARAARELGIGFQVIRANPDQQNRITDPSVIRRAVDAWGGSLEASLRSQLPGGLAWEEEAQGDYFTDKPDWAGYSGVILLAAHTVLPGYPKPGRMTVQFDEDAAYQGLAAQEFRCRSSQVFEVEIWLPCSFSFTFRAADLAGNEVRFGSSVALLEQLRGLNNETFKADDETLARWQFDGAGSHDEFDKRARFGMAMFLHHARLSVLHRLPMKLDY